MTGVKKQQEQFLAPYAKEARRVRLSVKRWYFETNACDLDILRGEEIVRVDSKPPMIDLSKFGANLGPATGIGPATSYECFKLKQDAVLMWLSKQEFLMECLEVRLPAVIVALKIADSSKIPYGVDLRQFLEASWSALLPHGSQESSRYLAIGRPTSKRVPYAALMRA